MIPEKEWKWFGHPGHLIVSKDCMFHLATQIGKYFISTIGDYRPDYKKGERVEVGCNRFYETMVFDAGLPCQEEECQCGMPSISGADIEMSGYQTAREAIAGHMAMCRKWAEA